MKSLNEWFARRANAEDGLVGHFWQERFGCRNLLDEGAILACSIYIDLNEIRAELAATPDDSTNTSAYRRILARLLRQARAEAQGNALHQTVTDYQRDDPDYWLCPLDERDRAPLLGPNDGKPDAAAESPLVAASPAHPCLATKRWRHGFLPVTVEEYLALLDWTGRQLVAGKRGAIDAAPPPLLERLQLQPAAWLGMIEHFEAWFHSAVGRAESMLEFALRTGRRWVQGLGPCRQVFS
jgi:hypothetical protein